MTNSHGLKSEVSKTKRFQTTLAECRKSINGVCDGCGGELCALRTVDNAGNPTYWVGCKSCSKFTNGTDKKVWKIARYLVTKRYWRPYSHMDEGEYRGAIHHSYWLRSQTSGAVSMVKELLGVIKTLKLEDSVLPPTAKAEGIRT